MQIKIILRNHITPVGMALSERQKRSAMKWTKENPCALLAGMQICTIIMENNMEVPQKLKIELLYEPKIPFLCVCPKKIKILKKIYAPACLIQHYL